MAEPAKIDLKSVKRGDTYIVDFFFTDTDGTKDISAVTIDAQARREMDGALWFDLKPIKVDASNGHFRIHLTHQETRDITESPPGSFSGIFDIQFSWAGANEVYVSTVVAGSISVSKDVTQPTSLSVISGTGDAPSANQQINLYYSLNPGSPGYSDAVTAEELTPVQYDLVASLGLANINAINEAGEAAVAKKAAQEAEASQKLAKQSEQIATIQAAKAQASADKAKEHEENAAAIVTGGDATLTPTPGKIPLANSKGEIDSGWLGFQLMTAQERQAIIDANEREFAASGMVNMGKAYLYGSTGSGVVNEGMFAWGSASFTDSLGLGAASGIDTKYLKGTSKKFSPVIHMAGVVSEITAINPHTNWKSNRVILPPAPAGYDVADSTGNVRGSGKPVLNLRKEVDPKYGDIAQTDNEAVARAFEGDVRNGDFRLGVEAWSSNADRGSFSVADGVATVTDTTNIKPNGSAMYIAPEDGIFKAGETYSVSIFVEELTDGMGKVRLGSYTDTNRRFEALKKGLNVFEYTATRSGAECILMYAYALSTLKISSVASKLVTEEVITDRTDMYGLEQFDMVAKDGEIFDMVQSQSSTFGTSGVPTVDSVRPESFFAVYDGQENIVKGKCVKWPNLNRAQKRHIAKYMKERLWRNEDGDITFTTLRQLSFAGAGNGDWDNIKPTVNGATELRYGINGYVYVEAQGDSDTTNHFTSAGDGNKYSSSSTSGISKKGVFTPRVETRRAYKGRCFFYVLGTVSRLNQGAKHPLNDRGARLFRQAGLQSARWHEYNLISQINTKADCFHLVQDGAPSTEAGAHPSSGYIGAPVPEHNGSGRDDGRFYDAVYADGLGGVVDRRLSAYDMSSQEEFAKAWEKVKNKTYRGLEKLVWTSLGKGNSFTIDGVPSWQGSGGGRATVGVVTGNSWAASGNGGTNGNGFNSLAGADTLATFYVGSNGEVFEVKADSQQGMYGDLYISPALDTTAYLGIGDQTRLSEFTSKFPKGTEIRVVQTTELNTLVSGNFNMRDVVGPPAGLLLTDALKNGWQGSWAGMFDGTSKIAFTRKSLSAKSTGQNTKDNGATWSNSTPVIDPVTNDSDFGGHNVPARIGIYPYTAFAKQTKPSTNKPVLNGEKGVGSVMQTAAFLPSRGCLLAESTIGAILTSNGSSGRSASSQLTNINLTDLSLLQEGGGSYQGQLHTPVGLGAPNNNSPAVKALPYQISDNGQANIGIQANELTWGTPTNVVVVTANNAGSTNIDVGTMYKVRGDVVGALAGRIFIGEAPSGVPINDSQWIITADNKIRHLSNAVVYGELVNSESSWGDDSTMKITASGSGTFVDRNGNTNLQVVHELALPIGWTHNHARVGAQVEGVDL